MTDLRPSEIATLRSQPWPANRGRRDFWTEMRESADLELRVTICGFCGQESPELSGPEGRAWFKWHSCCRPRLTLVKS